MKNGSRQMNDYRKKASKSLFGMNISGTESTTECMKHTE